jgi:signal transduction histidine kinase
LRQQIITSLGERITQLEAIHKVSLAITSQISLDTVLSQIATQAVNWLNADAAGIFLAGAEGLELATVYNLPQSYLHLKIPFGDGMVGTVARTRQSVYLENYNRDWKRESDLPLARETFGAVIAVPLIYRDQAIGVLMVVAGRQGRLFSGEDVEALELLAAQAAVAIAHSRLFAEQVKLGLQVETARSQLETVLSSTENPVIAVDRRFRLIFANPAARSLLPLERVSNDMRVINVLSPDILPSSLRVVLRGLRYDRAYTYEVSISGRVYLCHLAQLGRPGIAGWVAILNDVTQLKELDRLKSEMVRMTSHDLKNPLQAAMANLELLRDDLAGESDHEIQVSVHEIGKQLNRMNRIIGGILDLERIKTGKLQMEMCDPPEVIQNALDELRRFAHERQITLQTDVESTAPCFMADVEQFERALINLVENAIKFTPSGGCVVVRSRRDRESVLFEIEDNGIGIPESLQPQVFERFLRGGQRGQPGAENISGSGLGLSLVKAVVENHHGRIWLRSRVGEGTTFFISLPAVPESST